jgi:hypothetical protein
MPAYGAWEGGMKDTFPFHRTREYDVLLGKHIAKLRVGWAINAEGYISGFGRFGGKAGNGARAMREICLIADRWQQSLSLRADNQRLADWYKQFDFVQPDDDLWLFRSTFRLSPKRVQAYYNMTEVNYQAYSRAQRRHYREHPVHEAV